MKSRRDYGKEKEKNIEEIKEELRWPMETSIMNKWEEEEKMDWLGKKKKTHTQTKLEDLNN